MSKEIYYLDILTQRWSDDEHSKLLDDTSHGKILLTIGGHEILSEFDEIDDWSTITSMYRLLKTIDNSEITDRDWGVIIHCGGLYMTTCPISVNMKFDYSENFIIISNIVKYPHWDESQAIYYKIDPVKVDINIYKTQIIKAALKVVSFYKPEMQRIFKKDKNEYAEQFWDEFIAMINRHNVD